jgi:hypothetical protein
MSETYWKCTRTKKFPNAIAAEEAKSDGERMKSIRICEKSACILRKQRAMIVMGRSEE